MVDIDRFTMVLAAKGDNKAFKRLYDHYAPFVWRIVYRTAGSDAQAAQEIVQETFVRIHRSLKSFTGASSLGTWIYRITLNASNGFLANRLRRQSITLPLNNDLPGNISGPDEYETKEFVEKILDTLTPEDRFLLMAKEINGMVFRELSEFFGKTSESLRTRMSRLKTRINADFNKKRLFMEAVA
jgi:RNA polymerase sigma-70 factor, ECF subfamily